LCDFNGVTDRCVGILSGGAERRFCRGPAGESKGRSDVAANDRILVTQ
jgi:hypothetical protein